jgi:hypothetical protein
VSVNVAGVGEAGEAFGEAGRVLEGLELGFGVGVVVGDVGPGMRSGDAEIGEELGDGSRGHRAAAVGVQGQLFRVMPSAVGAGGDEVFGEAVGFAWGDEPADGVTGPDVEDDVEVEPGPFVGAGELGDVPGPHLVRAVATSSGLRCAGWRAWRRRSRTW